MYGRHYLVISISSASVPLINGVTTAPFINSILYTADLKVNAAVATADILIVMVLLLKPASINCHKLLDTEYGACGTSEQEALKLENHTQEVLLELDEILISTVDTARSIASNTQRRHSLINALSIST